MKRVSLLIFVLALASVSSADSAERVASKAWRKVKTYDMQTLQKMEPLPMRKIVGVRFNYRHRDIRHLKPNWFYGSIWSQSRSGGKADFTNIPVMVSKADLPSFKAIATDVSAGRDYIVYGQVLEDAEAKYLFLRLLGTRTRPDRRGGVLVSW